MLSRKRSYFICTTFIYAACAVFLLFHSNSSANDADISGNNPIADSNAFIKPFSTISTEQKFDHSLGLSLFEKFWIASPSSTTASDGLGPLYNARSCHSCHLKNGKGHAPLASQKMMQVPSFFIRLKQWPLSKSASPKEAFVGDPVYGVQIQTNANINLAVEADISVTYQYHLVEFADGSTTELRKPIYEVANTSFGAIHPNTQLSGRVSPAIVGVGLLDSVDDQTLLELADPDDADKDGISGKVNLVWDKINQKWRPGRFGWKANIATLSQQNQNAFNKDMGLSTPLFPNAYGDCTTLQEQCFKLANGNSPHMENLEVSSKVVRLVDTFTALSAPPKIRNLRSKDFLQGKEIFEQLACSSCHRPVMKTGYNASYPALSHKTFYPFTDLLLHDMGEGLADQGNEFAAKGNEWRTPPLWGLALNKIVSQRQSYLHDGRARTINEAILWHGGEAQKSRDAYTKMNATQRSYLMTFLESL